MAETLQEKIGLRKIKTNKAMKVGYPNTMNKLVSSPLYQKDPPKKYKTGDSLAEDKIVDNPKQFARPHDEYSEIQEDKKSQYVTTLAGDERPAGVNWDAKEEKKNIRKRKRSHFVASAGPKTGSRVARDTIRPKKGKKFTKQTRYPNIEKWEKEDLAVQAKRKN